jgi:hypothetical protein
MRFVLYLYAALAAMTRCAICTTRGKSHADTEMHHIEVFVKALLTVRIQPNIYERWADRQQELPPATDARPEHPKEVAQLQ